MFHNLHYYATKSKSGLSTPQQTLGAILPDFSISGMFPWRPGLHTLAEVEAFVSFATDHGFGDELAKGLYSHLTVDSLSHDLYKNTSTGYAFINIEALTQKVKEYYDLDQQEARGKAHNYKESAIDILLLRDMPHVQQELRDDLKKLDLALTSRVLGDYYKLEKQTALKQTKKCIKLFSDYDTSTITGWCEMWYELEGFLGLNHPTTAQKTELLHLAIDSARPTYMHFLEVVNNL